jgi:hypothetical protein
MSVGVMTVGVMSVGEITVGVVRLYLLYICHTVIHRKLENVVYMKKNRY